ncbi:MAG: phosphate acyltransferase [Chloroflexota bacterium]
MDLMKSLHERAARKRPKVVFPEAGDRKIVEAALKAKSLGIAEPILVGDPGQIATFSLDLGDTQVINPAASADAINAYAEAYAEAEGMPKSAIVRQLSDPLNFAAMMLRAGDADGMVAGLVHSTEDVILSSEMYVGLAEGVDIPSSYFVMDVPNWKGGEDGLIVFADCAVVTNPTSQELAGIALSSAASARALLGWEPRVAMISFSTKGSATHADVDKVIEAVGIARKADPGLCIDGELQVDSAVVPSVSEKKIRGENILKGTANVLIFPDLDAANAAYKLVQRLAGAAAYGPVLQGFAKPVSDLSRGATVDDIVGATTIVAAQV